MSAATVPYAIESRVIKAPINKVWEVVRSLEFKFWKHVKNVKVEGEDGLGIFFYIKSYFSWWKSCCYLSSSFFNLLLG